MKFALLVLVATLSCADVPMIGSSPDIAAKMKRERDEQSEQVRLMKEHAQMSNADAR